MRELIVFNGVTADGCLTDKNNDMSWAHRQADPFDEEIKCAELYR